ncbi:hypothetical protein ABBQ32_010724 [Trebouxia sp. C0010 RCD-2024]
MMRMVSAGMSLFHGNSDTNTPYNDLHQLTAPDIDLNDFDFSSLKEQEPGTNQEIKKFAREKGFKGVLMDKVDVNGPKASPVYNFLKAASGDESPIPWNFAKFLVKKDGTVFARYGPTSMAVELTPQIEKLLAEGKE